ncbi:g2464 [Coccomyxa elongata]
MATAPLNERPEKRGPKLGDAASLWNFTPSPGWTKEEAAILKLCLMKYGIGRWVQILETGLLPGKLIQQLNGQTQRLLGQQSLSAYTGLQVDIDRIRADNEQKQDVERKCGLIIWSGPNPTKKMKDEWQAEARAKYGLSAEQLAEVEAQLEDLVASVDRSKGSGLASGHVPLIDLIEAPLDALSREQKLLLLKRLRSKLASLVAALTAKQAGAPITKVHGTPVKRRKSLGLTERASNEQSVLPAAPQESKAALGSIGKGAAKKERVAKAGAKRRGRGAKEQQQQPDGRDDRGVKRRSRGKTREWNDPDGDFMDVDDATGVLADAEETALQADIASLQGMGFSTAKAKEALEECNYSMDLAIEWLVSNCVAAEADDSGDSFSWLIDILRHQPFTPNYASTTSPDIANLSSLLAEQPESEQTEFLLLILKVLRILSRKPANRQKVAEGDVAAIVRHLTGASRAVAGECANVILNLCFERANVSRLLKCNGVAPLVSLLKSPDTDVQASTCGVIQSICYLGRGRQATRDCAAIPELLALLGSGNGRVHARAVGALHNLSADPQSVRMTRRSNGIAPLTALLKCADMGTCAAAAGTLQNLAREAASRQLIRQQRAVPLLAALLSAPDLQARLQNFTFQSSAVCHWGIAEHLGTCAGALTQSSCPEKSIGQPAVMCSDVVHGGPVCLHANSPGCGVMHANVVSLSK